MAQDRTHQGRVDFGDGILLEPMAEPATELHGSMIFASGSAGNLFAKTLGGILYQLTPLASGGGSSTSSGLEVHDEGNNLGLVDVMNFSGAGVTARKIGNAAHILIPQTTSGISVRDEGNHLGLADIVNFSGAGVTAKMSGGIAHVLIPQVTSGIEVQNQGAVIGTFDRVNFSGLGVTAVANGTVADVVIPAASGGSSSLPPAPATDIADISSVPRWFKFVVPYTDIQTAASTIGVLLATIPIKAWIHAIHWKVTQEFSADWGEGDWSLSVRIGDTGDNDRWLSDDVILSSLGPVNIEDAIGLIPWEPDFSNTDNLIATFTAFGLGRGEDLTNLTAGEFTVWFLLSSMNAGAA